MDPEAEVWERGPKLLGAVDLTGWENCVIKKSFPFPIVILLVVSLC